MTLYANIVDGRVFGLFEGPDEIEMKLHLVKVDSTISVGDIYVDGAFTKPEVKSPTKAQIEEKQILIKTAVQNAVQFHLAEESKRTGIDFMSPETEESLEFYEKCTKVPEIADAQQALDFINSLPKFGT